MKHALALALGLLLAACAATSVETPRVIEHPDPARPQDPHAFLERFVGDWSVVAVIPLEPDQEPMRMESAESVRRVGGWIVGEGDSEFGGERFHSVLTVGYDPDLAAFVGSWVDTMSTHMWVYRGWLDATGNVLTLEAEGPGFEDPSVTRLYRDATEFVSDDHRVLRSSILMDGEWVEYMHADYRRRP